MLKNNFSMKNKSQITQDITGYKNNVFCILVIFLICLCILGLDSSLLSIFDPDETSLILDLAAYLLTEETDAFQHYPS